MRTDSSVQSEQVLADLASALAEVLAVNGLPAREVSLEDSLVDDLGIDSLMLVDLAVALEDHLGVDKVPLDDWVNAEVRAKGNRFTVRSLLSAVLGFLDQ